MIGSASSYCTVTGFSCNHVLKPSTSTLDSLLLRIRIEPQYKLPIFIPSTVCALPYIPSICAKESHIKSPWFDAPTKTESKSKYVWVSLLTELTIFIFSSPSNTISPIFCTNSPVCKLKVSHTPFGKLLKIISSVALGL